MEYLVKDDMIYLDSFYYVLNKIHNQILSSFSYEQIGFNDENNFINSSYFNKDILYLNKNSHSLILYYLNDDLLHVRTKMLDLLEIIKKTLHDEFGLYLFESNDISGKSYHLGLINDDLKYINVCDVDIFNEEKVYFKLKIDETLVHHILNNINDKKTISSKLSSFLFGIVLLDENRPGVKKKYNEICDYLTNNNYKVKKCDMGLSAKEQYAFLEENGVRYIIEVNYRKYRAGLIKIKNVFSGEFVEIKEDEFINNYFDSYIQTDDCVVYKNYLNNYFKYQKSENVVLICSSCLDNFLNNSFIKPLSNGIINGKCVCCNKKANHKLFKI